MQLNGFHLPKKIGIIYSDVKREYFPTEAQYITEKDALKDASLIGLYIEKLGIKTILYPGNSLLPEKLKADRPDMVLNLLDSIKGSEYLSSSIPGVLELLEIPYTGADILGKALDSNKFLVKKILEQNGIPIPHYQLFNSATDFIDPTLRFPLISKLNEVHGSVEITEEAVSKNEKSLRDRIGFLIKTYKQPVLVEEFIGGREIVAVVLEGLKRKVYLAEKIFSQEKEAKEYVFTTFNDVWTSNRYDSFHYQIYKDPILREYARKAFAIIGMADYGKFDIRMDSSGRYFFLDSNPNPAFGPKESACALSVILNLYGIDFDEILMRLIINTLKT